MKRSPHLVHALGIAGRLFGGGFLRFWVLDAARTPAVRIAAVNSLLTDLRRLREVALPLVGRDPVGCVYSQ
mgnify:CR=1 FL=1